MPSVNSFVAFCSEIPLTVSKIFLGLIFVLELPIDMGLWGNIRIGNTLNCVVPSFDNQLDISSCQTSNALDIMSKPSQVSRSQEGSDTSNEERGVGAPGPPMPSS